MIKKLWHDGNDRLLVSAFNGGMRVFDERQGRFSDLYMNHPASGQPLSVYDFAKEGDRGIWLTDPDAELMYKDASTGHVETVRLTDAQETPSASISKRCSTTSGATCGSSGTTAHTSSIPPHGGF